MLLSVMLQGLPIVGYTDLTEAKRDGIVTVVMDTGDKPLVGAPVTHGIKVQSLIVFIVKSCYIV